MSSRSPFKTIDHQILTIYSRGMKINGNQFYRDFLLRKNYYNSVNVYGKLFQDSSKLTERYFFGSHFSEIIALYFFDKKIREITLNIIVEAESNIKSTISYYFAKSLGHNDEYLDRKSFNLFNSKGKPIHDNFSAFKFLQKSNNKIFNKYYKYNNPSINSIDHHLRQNRKVPIWVLINYYTFGQVTSLYSILQPALQDEIAISFSSSSMKGYGVDPLFRRSQMINFISCLQELRNRIAHDNTLIYFNSRYEIQNFSFLNDLRKINGWNAKERVKYFPILTSVQLFTSKSNFILFQKELSVAISELLPSLISINVDVIFDILGFPSDWEIF